MPSSDSSSRDSSDVDENDVLEVSPNERWHKLRKKVTNKDSMGIEEAHLAYDTELGIEVVWNEITFSAQRMSHDNLLDLDKKFKALTQLSHNNIVKYYDFWRDKGKLVVITEFLTSGTVKQHLRKTGKMNKTVTPKVWKRWCTQILSALKYLHEQSPPIVHGNLKLGSMFIQHNGLVKVGAVCLEDINEHVRTVAGDQFQWIAPEVFDRGTINDKSDIYAFGMCCLEMASGTVPYCECPSAGERNRRILKGEPPEVLSTITDPEMYDFISACLADEEHRPSADDLLFHTFFFEVPLLKVMVAHYIIRNKSKFKFDDVSEEMRLFLKEVRDGAWGTLVNVKGDKSLANKPGGGSLRSSTQQMGSQRDLPADASKAQQGLSKVDASSTSSITGAFPANARVERLVEKRRVTKFRKFVASVVDDPVMGAAESAKEGSICLEIHLIFIFGDSMRRELKFLYRSHADRVSLVVDEMVQQGLVCSADKALMEKVLFDIVNPCISSGDGHVSNFDGTANMAMGGSAPFLVAAGTKGPVGSNTHINSGASSTAVPTNATVSDQHQVVSGSQVSDVQPAKSAFTHSK
eukprot:Nk52_evm54s226 gene=Nk52_evmTU54s226